MLSPVESNPKWTLYLCRRDRVTSCRVQFVPTIFQGRRRPVTLTCSHTCCLSCLKSLNSCPFDQTPINAVLPENEAILSLVADETPTFHNFSRSSVANGFGVSKYDEHYYQQSVDHIKEMAILLKPLQHTANAPISRPMQRKLVSLLHCQIIQDEGRCRALKIVRSIGERALSELLVKHQDPHSLSANLWAALRARGCQFLGPAMQEEVLKLVLLALEDGSALSRKVLVMFVVQRLLPHFPHQSSKTAIGHVIQLLYRASCFKLTKRDGDSSLMQLKEEFCFYETLRRDHDAQIVSIAMEAGLRISPDLWSSLLYGDQTHKSHMQSIIDRLQSPQSFSMSIQKLVMALQRSGDPANLSELRIPLETLAQIEASPNPESDQPTHEELSLYLESCRMIIFKLTDFTMNFATLPRKMRPERPPMARRCAAEV
ncbi:Roquin-1 [Halotydeus destructor]|nr:Roquin-1 [Halotydeus destructor]